MHAPTQASSTAPPHTTQCCASRLAPPLHAPVRPSNRSHRARALTHKGGGCPTQPPRPGAQLRSSHTSALWLRAAMGRDKPPAKRRKLRPSRATPAPPPLPPTPGLAADQLALPDLYAFAAQHCASPRLIAPPATDEVDCTCVRAPTAPPASHRTRRGYSTLYVPDSGPPSTSSKAGGRCVTPEQLLRLLHVLAAFSILRPTPPPSEPLSLAYLLQRDAYHLSVDSAQLKRVREAFGEERVRGADQLLLSHVFTLSAPRAARSKRFGGVLGGRAEVKLRGREGGLLLAVLLAYARDAARLQGGVGVRRAEAAFWHVTPRLDDQNLSRWTQACTQVLGGLAREDEAQPGWLSTPAAGGRQRAPSDSPGYKPPGRRRSDAPDDASPWASHLCGREGCLHPAHLRVLSPADDRTLMVLHQAAADGVLATVRTRR